MKSAEYSRCLRKRRHTNYLSALRHAASLDRDIERLVIYPCEFCGALHVGYQQRTVQRPEALRYPPWDFRGTKYLVRAKLRLQRALRQVKRDSAKASPETLQRSQQRITDLRKHLTQLESLAGEAQNAATKMAAAA